MMCLRPMKRKDAAAWVKATHRHLSPPVGDVIRVGVESDGLLVGVAMAGRPVARCLDDGRTLEVTRVATVGVSNNACSMLYGAIRRAAAALGYRKLITYTRCDEPGSSLLASGFRRDAVVQGREWDAPGRRRRPAEQPVDKQRWVLDLA